MKEPRGIFIPLVRSIKHPSPLWRIPGGGKEFGEAEYAAALREFREETLISTDSAQEIRHVETLKKGDGHRQKVFVCIMEDIQSPPPGQVVPDGEDLLVTKLFSYKELYDYLNHGKLSEAFEGFHMLGWHKTFLSKLFNEQLEILE